jgi:hypothetical protein
MKLHAAILGSISAMALIAAAASANAGIVTWDLSGVTFDDGTTATGSFQFDTTLGQVTGEHISTSNGTLSAFTYDDANSGLNTDFYQPNSFYAITVPSLSRYIELAFAAPLSGTAPDALLIGNPDNVSAPGSYECDDCLRIRLVTGGEAVRHIEVDRAPNLPGVPEPASWALMISGFGLAGVALRRRRALVVA